MITEVNAPEPIVRAGNEAEYEASTNNRITTAGVTYKQKFLNIINPTDGLTLTVVFGSYNETFTFKNTPVTDFDIQIPASPSGFDTALRANMADTFNKHYTIVANYHVCNIAGGIFSIEARVAATTIWDITWGGTVISGGNFTIAPNFPEAGVTQVMRDGFRIQFEVWQYLGNTGGSDIYSLLLEEKYPPDTNETIIADIAEVLYSLLEHDLPSYNQLAPSLCTKVLKKFQVRYGEFYSDAVQNYIARAQQRALLATLPEAEIPANTFYNNHFVDAIGQLFLTTIPRDVIKTNKAAQHYLYYYQRPAYATAYYTLYIEHTDGVQIAVDQLFTLSQPDDIIILPTGYTQLDIDSLKSVGKTVKRWGVEIGANGLDYQDYTDRTEIFWYNLDERPYAQNRYFLLGNPYGGIDTLWCTGAAQYSKDAEAEQYNIYKAGDSATIINATQKNTRGQVQSGIKISTGFVSRVYMQYVASILTSNTLAYEVVGGKFVAVLIDRSSIKETHTDADGKYEITFSYKYAQEDK